MFRCASKDEKRVVIKCDETLLVYTIVKNNSAFASTLSCHDDIAVCRYCSTNRICTYFIKIDDDGVIICQPLYFLTQSSS